MITIKTPGELAVMQEGGKILAKTLEKVVESINVGVSEERLEEIATSEIEKMGGSPAFKKVPGYNYTLCISTNDAVVHGIPGKYTFKKGDVVGIDCGVFYKGFNTDMSETVIVGTKEDEKVKKFLEVGKKALLEGIAQAVPGNRVGHISKKIQEVVEKEGYSIVRTLVGHGIGKKLHEEPEVPGFLNRKIEKTPLLKEGMTLAIEVIYNMGKKGVKYGSDNWTIKTEDGQLSGLFERTIAITKGGPLILTR
jgi:methionyl aminopeptidase